VRILALSRAVLATLCARVLDSELQPRKLRASNLFAIADHLLLAAVVSCEDFPLTSLLSIVLQAGSVFCH
jgi:hypothetical protein